MRVVPPHNLPGPLVPPHTPKPKMLPGMWELTPDTKISAGRIQLIAVQLKVPTEDLERIDVTKRRWGLQLVVDKAGVSLFKIEAVAIMRYGDITARKKLMKLFNEQPVVVEALFVAGKVGKRPNNRLVFSAPIIGKAQHIPVF